MPLTDYHTWALPELSAKEPEESIAFTELENDMGNGYFSAALYGSNTGQRTWRLSLQSLADTSVLPNTVIGGDTGVSGGWTLSREAYVWDLFCNTKVTGQPFAYLSPRNGQYYLVRFADKELTYKKMLVKLYSTGVELKQVRVDGQTIYSPARVSRVYTHVMGPDYDDGTGWVPSAGKQGFPTVTGDIEADGSQNGIDTTRFNVTTNDGFVKNDVTGKVIYEAFFVMKMREATFSNAAGILTGSGAGTDVLVGSSGTTKFANPGLSASNYQYYLNGVAMAQSDQQAPMNTWGVVHVRYATGWTFPALIQVGKKGATAGTFAEVDIAEIILCDSLLPMSDARELEEHLAVQWGVV